MAPVQLPEHRPPTLGRGRRQSRAELALCRRKRASVADLRSCFRWVGLLFSWPDIAVPSVAKGWGGVNSNLDSLTLEDRRAMPRCTHCGKVNREGSLFCQDCGHKLESASIGRSQAAAGSTCGACGTQNPPG